MSLYVDTATPSEASKALSLAIVAGVTTNPTLIRRTGADERAILTEIVTFQPKRLFVQLVGKSQQDFLVHRDKIRDMLPNSAMVFKIPPTWPAIEFCEHWHEQDDFLVTAVNTIEQAYVAQQAGAKYVAVYLHRYRLRNGEWPPLDEIKRATQGHLRVMIASCHDITEVRWALINGADDVTLPFATIQALLFSKDTEDDIARFDQDVLRNTPHAD